MPVGAHPAQADTDESGVSSRVTPAERRCSQPWGLLAALPSGEPPSDMAVAAERQQAAPREVKGGIEMMTGVELQLQQQLLADPALRAMRWPAC